VLAGTGDSGARRDKRQLAAAVLLAPASVSMTGAAAAIQTRVGTAVGGRLSAAVNGEGRSSAVAEERTATVGLPIAAYAVRMAASMSGGTSAASIIWRPR
jgi:hypothetical protein